MDTISLEGKKILVVEDDDMSFIFLKQIFKLIKGTIIRAKSGREALHEYKSSSGIDLILMDIQLPDINGNEITAEIRKSNSNIPIIAQTAGRTPQDIEAAIDAGSSEVITKPFSMEDLLGVLKKYMK